eukprot:CAMPEP_0181048370 /NCGR_PEP_ID=MMETSP1070-20121207/15397_1 /TAXON_ID=265543 /ORGANISM="Minutocellus polymorphus, Strain NH13" /LENGTH=145 /DNA_ID=CAMNT_0023127145 /DNA_START=258 /DNA_END=692 /DNA_ORIENTATION=-
MPLFVLLELTESFPPRSIVSFMTASAFFPYPFKPNPLECLNSLGTQISSIVCHALPIDPTAKLRILLVSSRHVAMAMPSLVFLELAESFPPRRIVWPSCRPDPFKRNPLECLDSLGTQLILNVEPSLGIDPTAKLRILLVLLRHV